MATKQKPLKPFSDFPLYAHASGQWAKKIRGKVHYFGTWADWRLALDTYLAQKDDLQAGRDPRALREGATVSDLVNRFLADKETQVELGEMSRRTFTDYHAVARRIVEAFGLEGRLDDLRPDDFSRLRSSYPKSWSVVTLGNEICRARVIFNYAGPDALALVDRAISFGPIFKRPSQKAMRINRAAKPKKLFSAEEIRRALEITRPQLRAMSLLGINAGLGNHDCAGLTFERLEGDWLVYPRPKTGVPRRAWLWPETREAIVVATEGREQASRPDHVFLTRTGRPWLPTGCRQKATGTTSYSCPISKEFRKALNASGVYRPGLSFYALRHTFQTIAERSGDAVAVSAVMGHVDSTMAGNYREAIDDDRFEKVSAVVREWLFG